MKSLVTSSSELSVMVVWSSSSFIFSTSSSEYSIFLSLHNNDKKMVFCKNRVPILLLLIHSTVHHSWWFFSILLLLIRLFDFEDFCCSIIRKFGFSDWSEYFRWYPGWKEDADTQFYKQNICTENVSRLVPISITWENCTKKNIDIIVIVFPNRHFSTPRGKRAK